jgi:hypothetical protein
MYYPKELLDLFDDPLLDGVKPRPKRLTADDRRVRKLQEISEWVKSKGRIPGDSGDLKEKLLATALKALRNEANDDLKAYDELNLL